MSGMEPAVLASLIGAGGSVASAGMQMKGPQISSGGGYSGGGTGATFSPTTASMSTITPQTGAGGQNTDIAQLLTLLAQLRR